MKKLWISLGILAFIFVCIGFGDKKRLHYFYEIYITPIIESVQMNPDHIRAD
ncbi:hypothetical protein LCGC14_0219850 [marine sediment metagenome]|uniref:Uncharacterized protein n=1 Tax=marine sediment metagenome TaxID=412755 RepID=A0A0F9UD55_9ZZZZ